MKPIDNSLNHQAGCLNLTPRLHAAIGRLKTISMTENMIAGIEARAVHDLRGAVHMAENLADIVFAADAGFRSGGLGGVVNGLLGVLAARKTENNGKGGV